MLAEFEIADLIETLFDSEPSIPGEYSKNSEGVVQRKKRNRRRYDAPKVFKNDVRWSYSNMFVNVLSASDVYLMYDFLSTYAVVDFLHVNHLESNECISNIGIESFLKHWFVSTCVSPDIVYKMSHPNVRNLPDGSSEISLILTVRGNFIYDKPHLEDDSDECTSESSDEVVVGRKRKTTIQDQPHRSGGRSRGSKVSGVRSLVSSSQQQGRVRVGEYCPVRRGYLCSSLLAELDSIVMTSFSRQPVSVESSGTFTMRLDRDKRITSTLFELIGSTIQPIALSEV